MYYNELFRLFLSSAPVKGAEIYNTGVFDDADHDPIMILRNNRLIDQKSIDKYRFCHLLHGGTENWQTEFFDDADYESNIINEHLSILLALVR